MAPSREVIVLIECTNGEPTLPSLCALSFARELGQLTASPIALCCFATVGTNPTPLLGQLGVNEVLWCDTGDNMPPLAEICAPIVARLVRERNTAHVVAAATSFGKDLLPRIAGILDTSYVGDCTGLVQTENSLRFLRPIHAGNFSVECEVDTATPVIVSVRSSEFAPAQPLDTTPCPIVPVLATTTGAAIGRIAQLGFEPLLLSRPALSDAEVIVSGGRALKERFFETLGPLADCLGAALGATRAVCDEGVVPSDYQVGQTGKIVAPKLYIAVGISGTVQHIAGMRSSRTIVAINVDPDAPIFALADYGLVGDLFEHVPALTAAIEQLRRNDT